MAVLVLDRHNVGKTTYLSGISRSVSLATGSATDVLKFRTPKRNCAIQYDINIDNQLGKAGDLYTISWILNGQTQHKTAFKTINDGEQITIPVNKSIYASNSLVEVEILFTKSASGPPAVNCNATVYGMCLDEGTPLF